MYKRAPFIVAAFAVLFLPGCASSGGGPESGGSATLITRAEIEATNVADLYDVVQRLRPRWFNVRGSRSFGLETSIVVFQGQTFLGDISVLKDLGRDAADQLRYMDGPRASATLPGLGGRHVEGAIIIDSRQH